MSNACPISGKFVARKNPGELTKVVSAQGKEVRFCCSEHKATYLKKNPDAKEVLAGEFSAPPPVILVDLDETLVHSIPWFHGKNPIEGLLKAADYAEGHAERDPRYAESQRVRAKHLREFARLAEQAPVIDVFGKITVTARPDAMDFLRRAKNVGTVALYTAADRRYAEAALAAHGFDRLIEHVFTTRDKPTPAELVAGRPWVLVDDLMNYEKIVYMGSPSGGYIKMIPAFDAGDEITPLPAPKTLFPVTRT